MHTKHNLKVGEIRVEVPRASLHSGRVRGKMDTSEFNKLCPEGVTGMGVLHPKPSFPQPSIITIFCHNKTKVMSHDSVVDVLPCLATAQQIPTDDNL